MEQVLVLETLITTHFPLRLSNLPPDPIGAGATGTSNSPRTELASPPPEASGAAGLPVMETVALVVLAALSLAALRLRFSDAAASDPQAGRERAEEQPVVPRPGLLFRRSHHEKMHDQKYLSRILEAELESPGCRQAGEDGDDSQPRPR